MLNFLSNIFGKNKNTTPCSSQNTGNTLQTKNILQEAQAKHFEVLSSLEDVPFDSMSATEIQIITVADTHSRISRRETEEALEDSPNLKIVFFLGDISIDDMGMFLEVLDEKFPNSKDIGLFAVLGNHDTPEIINEMPRVTFVSKFPLEYSTLEEPKNIVQFKVENKTINIVGMSGSIRYTDEPHRIMVTNEESIRYFENIPDKCDILITHDKPCLDDNPPEFPNHHAGLVGIWQYIKRAKPKYILHGHIHDRYVHQYSRISGVHPTECCCYSIQTHTIRI